VDASRFDNLSKFFAERRISRRQAMIQGGAGIAVAGIAAAGLTRASGAQDATPAAGASPEAGGTGPKMLFLQTYQSGTISPKEGDEGRYILSLESGGGQTVFFSDRPDRIVGTNPTPQFLEGLGFPDDNPPNAALVVETGPTDTDIAVVELYAPEYDPVSQSVTYEIEVLANWQAELEMDFSEAPTDLATFVPSFGAAQLFIDDCPDADIECYYRDPLCGEGCNEDAKLAGSIPNAEHDGFCYSWGAAKCFPCSPWIDGYYDVRSYWTGVCNERFSVCTEAGVSLNQTCSPSPICRAGLGCG
jgi:hypothetical protein